MSDLLRGSRRINTAITVIWLLITPQSWAAPEQEHTAQTIEVFTTAAYPVSPTSLTNALSAPDRYQAYPIDAINRLQDALSEDLPSDPEPAKQLVLQRFRSSSSDLNQSLEQAAKGLAKAVQYGIDRYPAMVFDAEFVLYGVTDVNAAVNTYQQWRRAQRQ